MVFPSFLILIKTSNFLSLSNPNAKYPSDVTLIFWLSIETLEPGSVFPRIKDPCSNFPLNSTAKIIWNWKKNKNVKSKKCLWNYNEFYPLKNQSNDLGRFNDFPDVSHLIASLKGTAGYDLIQWANWLKLPRNAGFDGGWRFDYVKGINASYINTFRKQTDNSFGILECWDSLENIEKYS